MFKLKKEQKSPFVVFKKVNNLNVIKKRTFTDVDLSENPIVGLSIKSKPFLISINSFFRQTGGMVTGDYEERQYKIANINFGRGKHCDCCGEIIYIPYNDETLCPRCKEYIEGTKKKSYLISDFEQNKKRKLDKVWFVSQN